MKLRSTLVIISFFWIYTSLAQTRDKCNALLDEGIGMLDKAMYTRAIPVFLEAESISNKQNWYDENFTANNCLAVVYCQYSDYGKALTHLLRAFEVANEYLSPKEQTVLLNNIAAVYIADENYKEALSYQIRAYEELKNYASNDSRIGVFSGNVAGIYNRLNQPEKALPYIKSAFKYIKRSDLRYWVIAKFNYAEALLLMERYDESIAILLAEYENAKLIADNDVKGELVTLLSEGYGKKGDYGTAIRYAKEGIDYLDDLTGRKRLFNLLADYSYKLGDFEKAMVFKDSVIAVTNTFNNVKNTRLFESNKIKFDLQEYKKEVAEKEQYLIAERYIYVAAILVFFIIIYLLYKLFKTKLYKENQQKRIAEHEHDIIRLELEKQKDNQLLLERQLQAIEKDALLEQEQLRNEIEQKNRKLSAKALNLSGRNQLIEGVIKSLTSLVSEHHSMLLQQQLKVLKSHLRTDNDWESFVAHFEEVNQKLLAGIKLRHPDLNANDIRFICYIYMNLNTDEICTIFNITQEAFRKRRIRIAKKMGVPDGDCLYNYLSGLSA